MPERERSEEIEGINMAIKIIDNKKIEMTEDEWLSYRDICRSYDRPNFKGEELFKDLFETDDNGIIVFLRPPSTRHTSMEVFLFVSIIMQQQQMRLFAKRFDALCEEVREKVENHIKKL